ncbi:hypothetical protein BGX33_009973 [Mortierella sp. NVP41]|nr:hypothetical protein BGX33_009973 [Mortierella sp. NVP41]
MVVYVETGVGRPWEIVKEFETVRWFYGIVDWDHPYPKTDKVRLCQIMVAEGEPISVKDSRAADESANVEAMTPEEEEDEDLERLADLDDWFEDQLERGDYQSFEDDPDLPDRPPDADCSILEYLEVLYDLLDLASERVFRHMEAKHGTESEEELELLNLQEAELRVIVEATAWDSVDGLLNKINPTDQHASEDKAIAEAWAKIYREPISTVLYHGFHEGWNARVLERAKNLVKSRLL